MVDNIWHSQLLSERTPYGRKCALEHEFVVNRTITQAIKKNYGSGLHEALMRVLHLGNEPKSGNGTTEKLLFNLLLLYCIRAYIVQWRYDS